MAPLIKFTATHYRKDGVSHEDFIKWFTEQHLPAALPLMKKYGIKKYNLFVTPQDFANEYKNALANIQPGWKVSQVDCVLEYQVEDLKQLFAMIHDPEWIEKAAKDENEWVDLSKAEVHFGFDTPYLLETGDIVNLAK